MVAQRGTSVQLIVSLLIALLIVAVTISVVSAQFPLREVPREQEQHGGGGNSGPG
jgi:hypothetical protein